jgi:hypothetical protein
MAREQRENPGDLEPQSAPSYREVLEARFRRLCVHFSEAEFQQLIDSMLATRQRDLARMRRANGGR